MLCSGSLLRVEAAVLFFVSELPERTFWKAGKEASRSGRGALTLSNETGGLVRDGMGAL